MRVRKIYGFLVVLAIITVATGDIIAQSVPAADENIPYLMTFGRDGDPSWGDDDFSQTFFFKIPPSYREPFYIRVFDPDTGGDIDEINGVWDTRMSYAIYGGKDLLASDEAKGIQPTGDYRSGVLLASRIFGNDARYDNNWYTFGPFNPTEGEFIDEFGGYVFKIIAEGESGDDGNLYRYFLSKSRDENIPIEDGNAFTYEYTFRMWNTTDNVSHIYPYIDTACVFIRTSNWDWDDDGFIRVVSVVRRGQLQKISGDNEWAYDRIRLDAAELNTSLDFQFIKKPSPMVRNNNVVISVENQYGETLPFFVVPIGGVPVYRANIEVKKINK